MRKCTTLQNVTAEPLGELDSHASQQKGPRASSEHTKGGAVMLTILQRSLHCMPVQRPVAARRVEFCLLCCQPEPMPQSLPARKPQLTLQHPCRQLARSGWTIHMLCRAWRVRHHSITMLSGYRRMDIPLLQSNIDRLQPPSSCKSCVLGCRRERFAGL